MIRRILSPVGGSVLFLLVAGLVFGGLWWVTVSSLRVEDAQQEAASRAELEHNLHLALWRLDGRMLPSLGVEDSRPYHHYAAHSPGDVTAPYGPASAPLLANELPSWMKLHFEIDAETGWRSPQVPSPAATVDLQERWPELLLHNTTPERAAYLLSLQTAYPVPKVVALFAAREQASPSDHRVDEPAIGSTTPRPVDAPTEAVPSFVPTTPTPDMLPPVPTGIDAPAPGPVQLEEKQLREKRVAPAPAPKPLPLEQGVTQAAPPPQPPPVATPQGRGALPNSEYAARRSVHEQSLDELKTNRNSTYTQNGPAGPGANQATAGQPNPAANNQMANGFAMRSPTPLTDASQPGAAQRAGEGLKTDQGRSGGGRGAAAGLGGVPQGGPGGGGPVAGASSATAPSLPGTKGAPMPAGAAGPSSLSAKKAESAGPGKAAAVDATQAGRAASVPSAAKDVKKDEAEEGLAMKAKERKETATEADKLAKKIRDHETFRFLGIPLKRSGSQLDEKAKDARAQTNPARPGPEGQKGPEGGGLAIVTPTPPGTPGGFGGGGMGLGRGPTPSEPSASPAPLPPKPSGPAGPAPKAEERRDGSRPAADQAPGPSSPIGGLVPAAKPMGATPVTPIGPMTAPKGAVSTPPLPEPTPPVPGPPAAPPLMPPPAAPAFAGPAPAAAPVPEVAPSALTVHPGPMRPQWLTAEDGTDILVMVRAARVGGKVVYQGVVFDWPKLRAVLQDEVQGLFPDGRLIPVKDPDGVSRERTMAALPVQLDPGSPPPLPPAGWTPLRLGLVLVWSAAILAFAAVGLCGWSLIDLSERRFRFVSAVTHELRTPLTSLRLYLDLLLSGMVKDEAKRTEYLSTLNAESDRLHRLIDNVLDFARLERRRAGKAARAVSVADLLDRLRQTWTDRCGTDGKELVVISTLPPDAEVTTDPDMVQQIVGNLIDNARKYTRDATDPRIWVWAKPDGAGRVVFEVEDRGAGVPVRERGRIFRPFRRGESADTQAGGAGLGLALSRQWAEMLGGRLTYRPADGGIGACFRLELRGK